VHGWTQRRKASKNVGERGQEARALWGTRFMKIVVAALAAALALGAIAPALAQDISGEVLAKHNALRAKHGVPALSWSGKLASTAQDWANRCVFEHSNNGLGENLAQGDGFPPAQFV
jgi:uncharacterized protein YkwD